MWVAAAALFLGLMGVYTVPLQIGALVDGVGLSPANAANLGSAELLAVALTTMVLGPRISLFKLSALATTGAVTVAAAQVGTAMLDNMAGLLVARVVVGIGSGCALAAVTAAIATSSDPDRLYGRAFAVMSLGFAIFLAALPYAATGDSHAGLFAALGVTALMLIACVRALPAQAHSSHRTESNERMNWPAILVLFIVITLVYCAFGGSYYFGERIGVDIGVSPEIIGVAYGASALAGFLGAGIAGMRGSAQGRTVPLIVGFTMSGMVCMGILLVSNQLAFLTALTLWGGVYMYTITYLLGTAAALDPQARVATIGQGVCADFSVFGNGAIWPSGQRFQL